MKAMLVALTLVAVLVPAATDAPARGSHRRAPYAAAPDAAAPGYGYRAFFPNKCVVDEGYGRWSDCSGGGT